MKHRRLEVSHPKQDSVLHLLYAITISFLKQNTPFLQKRYSSVHDVRRRFWELKLDGHLVPVDPDGPGKTCKNKQDNLVGIGPLPCSHDSVNSLIEEGKRFQSKISRIKPQIILAIWQSKNM
jgi:hypothetical protein